MNEPLWLDPLHLKGAGQPLSPLDQGPPLFHPPFFFHCSLLPPTPNSSPPSLFVPTLPSLLHPRQSKMWSMMR